MGEGVPLQREASDRSISSYENIVLSLMRSVMISTSCGLRSLFLPVFSLMLFCSRIFIGEGLGKGG